MGENRAPVLEMTTQRRTPMLRTLLSGGDRRSIGRSNRALELIRANPSRVSAIAELAQDADWLIAMRAVDLLEKLARQNPEWVEPHKRIFLGALADSDKWEIRLQVVRALALFGWTPTEQKRAVEILLRDVDHSQQFVKAWALDSLATFAEEDKRLMPIVRHLLRVFERSGSKALTTRAKRIRERLSQAVTGVPIGPTNGSLG